MLCSESGRITELEFVNEVMVRQPGSCIGPVVKLAMSGAHLAVLEAALPTEGRDYLLHNYVHDDDDDESSWLVFGLCCLHWLDLSHVIWRNARAFGQGSWAQMSQAVLQAACSGAGMDPKEISNLFIWRGVSLT